MELTVRPWTGYVTLETRDAVTGELLDRITAPNAYTQVGAEAYAAKLAGGTASITLTAADLGNGGQTISMCDSIIGWSGSPALDTSVYRQGIGALRGSASASGTTNYYHATSAPGGTAMISGASDAVELYLRLSSRTATNLAASALRVYTGSTANYRQMTFSAIESAGTVTLADATWVKPRIPTTSGSWTTVGSPSWGTVTGMGVVLVAAGAGTTLAYWDQCIGIAAVGTAAGTVAAFAVTPGSLGSKTLTDLTNSGGGTIIARTAWVESEMVGDAYWAGLYSGATLVACAPLTYYKPAGAVLSLVWTVTVAGG